MHMDTEESKYRSKVKGQIYFTSVTEMASVIKELFWDF